MHATAQLAHDINDHAITCISNMHGEMVCRDDRLYDMLMDEIRPLIRGMDWEQEIADDISVGVVEDIIDNTNHQDDRYCVRWVMDILTEQMQEFSPLTYTLQPI